MGNHVGFGLPGEARGQINPGPQQSENKRRCDGIAYPDVPYFRHSLRHKMPHPEIAKQQIAQHQCYTHAPHQWKRGCLLSAPGLCGGAPLLGLRWNPVGRDRLRVDERRIHGLLEYGGGLRDHADRALDGHRKHQPQSNQGPKGADAPPRGLLQKQPQDNHRNNQPIRHQADMDEFRKYNTHIHPSSAWSIICLTSSRSSSVNGRLLENAARNAGKEPWNAVSTNCSLCME